MSKKIIMCILAMILIFSGVQNVHAKTLSTDGETTSVTVKYTADTTAFEIVIPAFICPAGENSSFTVASSYMNLRPDEYVEVSIADGCKEGGKVSLKRQNVPAGKPVSVLETVLTIDNVTLDRLSYVVGRFEDGKDSTKNLIGSVMMGKLNINRDTEAGDYQAVVEFKVDLKNRV